MDLNYAFYFPSDQESGTWGVSSTGLGKAVIKPNEDYPPRPHPLDHMFQWENGRILQSFQLIYISQGSGQFESKSAGKLPLKAGELFILFPSEWHRYRPIKEEGWTEYWIELSGKTLQSLLHSKLITPSQPILFIGASPDILSQFQLCRSIMDSGSVNRSTTIGLIGLEILAMAVGMQTSAGQADSRIEQAKVELSNGASPQKTLEELASRLGMAYSSFRRSFKSSTGLTPKQYQLHMRHRKCQDLLANTSLSLFEIAEALHYDSAFHLSADFKKRSGQSPQAWRQQFRQERRAAVNTD